MFVTKWEYLTRFISVREGESPDGELNISGWWGWELVNIVLIEPKVEQGYVRATPMKTDNYRVFFKRPLLPERGEMEA